MAELSATVRSGVSLATVLVRRSARDRSTLALPAAGRLHVNGSVMLLWTGPDRFLAIGDGSPSLAQELAVAFADTAYVTDVSASRLLLDLSGPHVLSALSRLAPLDLHPRAFPPGSVAATVAGHIDLLIWRPGDALSFGLACPSSYGQSLRQRLSHL